MRHSVVTSLGGLDNAAGVLGAIPASDMSIGSISIPGISFIAVSTIQKQ